MQTAQKASDPETAVVFLERINPVRTVGAVPVDDVEDVEAVCLRIESVEAAVGRQPYVVVAVLAYVSDSVVRQRLRLVGMTVPYRRGPVRQPDCSVGASEPQVTLAVPENFVYFVAFAGIAEFAQFRRPDYA